MAKRRTGGPARKAGWRQWTPDEARRVVEAWRSSGLRLATFARKRGITAERLRWWSKRLGDWREAPGEKPLQLAPVVITDVRPVAVVSGGVVTVRPTGDVVIELGDVGALPAAWLSALVNGLVRPAP